MSYFANRRHIVKLSCVYQRKYGHFTDDCSTVDSESVKYTYSWKSLYVYVNV
jgi:hypothetical protein